MRSGEPTGQRDIEITPEMVEAGVAELVQYEPEWTNKGDAVRAIFCAMASVSHRGEKSGLGLSHHDQSLP